MFDRVSTVDLSLYPSMTQGIPYIVDGVFASKNLSGIFVGKKWSGTLTLVKDPVLGGISDVATTPVQTEAGWIEYTDSVIDQINYPAVDFKLKNLPDFVNGARSSSDFQGGGSTTLLNTTFRFLVGDGTQCVGPFTLAEALYVYSVVRKIEPDASFFTSVSAQASDLSGQLSAGTKTDGLNSINESTQAFSLFQRLKEYSEYYRRDNDVDYSGEINKGYDMQASIFGYVSYVDYIYNQSFYNDMFPVLVIDIDKPEDFYIYGIGYRFYVEAGAGATSYNQEDNGPTLGTATTTALKRHELKPERLGRVYLSYPNYEQGDDTPVVGSFSQNVGDSYNSSWFTETLVSCDCTYTFGNITKTHKYYGFTGGGTDTSTTGDEPPSPPSASVTNPLPALSISATKFFPYKTANGQPVYNITTGAIVNSPIP